MKDSSLAEKWEALLQLAKVREPKLHDYLRVSRAKSETAYNVIVAARTASECQHVLRGVKIFSDVLEDLTTVIWASSRGFKVEQAEVGDAWLWGDDLKKPSVSGEEFRQWAWKLFYPEIRKQLEEELKTSAREAENKEATLKLLEDLKKNQENAEIQEKINLLGRGNEELTAALKTWEKMLKFVEDRDLGKLDGMAREMETKTCEFLRILCKLEH